MNTCEFSPYHYYAKIRNTSKYRRQHASFFIVELSKRREGLWLGNENCYPESEIELYTFDPKSGLREFGVNRSIPPKCFTLAQLKKMGLMAPSVN